MGALLGWSFLAVIVLILALAVYEIFFAPEYDEDEYAEFENIVKEVDRTENVIINEVSVCHR
jgi:uncharacterized membrane protein YdfJ with MMPL/SSD domain